MKRPYKPAHGGYPGMVLKEKEGRLASPLRPQAGYPVDRFRFRPTDTAMYNRPR